MSYNKGKNATVHEPGSGVRRLNMEEILQAVFSLSRDSLYFDKVPLSYEKHEDEVSGVIYEGWAQPGTGTDEPGWRIRKMTAATGSYRWADRGNFSQVWDDRASLDYE